jgi:hypothetical protein
MPQGDSAAALVAAAAAIAQTHQIPAPTQHWSAQRGTLHPARTSPPPPSPHPGESRDLGNPFLFLLSSHYRLD